MTKRRVFTQKEIDDIWEMYGEGFIRICIAEALRTSTKKISEVINTGQILADDN